MIVKGLHKNNLYKINFTNMHGVDAVNFAQPVKKHGARKFRRLNVKSDHALLSTVSGINLDKIICPKFCQILKYPLRINIIRNCFLMMEAKKQLSL